jgi:hypothetical protein
MKTLKFTGIVFTAIALVFILIGFIAPKDFSLERSIIINSSPDEVYQNMCDLRKFHDWSPWSKLDPNSKVSYEGEPNTVGHIYKWEGNKEVGKGEMSISKIENGATIYYHLNFIEPFASQADGLLKAENSNGATKATWTFTTKFGFIESVFMMFMNMEKMLGTDFENGLKNLKQISEK